jgi:hypothetical protein
MVMAPLTVTRAGEVLQAVVPPKKLPLPPVSCRLGSQGAPWRESASVELIAS